MRMDTVFMNSKNSQTFNLHRLLLKLRDKIRLNRSIYYAWKNIKKSYKNNKFIMSDPTCNENFELRGGSYYVPDIQD